MLPSLETFVNQRTRERTFSFKVEITTVMLPLKCLCVGLCVCHCVMCVCLYVCMQSVPGSKDELLGKLMAFKKEKEKNFWTSNVKIQCMHTKQQILCYNIMSTRMLLFLCLMIKLMTCELPLFHRSWFLRVFSITKKLILQQRKAPLIPKIKDCFNELSDLTEFKVVAIYIYIN